MKKTQLNVSANGDGTQDLAGPSTQIAGNPAHSLTLPDDCGRFVRMGELRRLFGITRPTAYLLARDGRIRTVSLRRPGRSHGARLVSLPSVRAYLRELLEEQRGQTKRDATTR